MKKTPVAAAISSVLASAAITAPQFVLAQDNDEEEARTLEEVVVTGSRIKRDAFSSSAPMDIIDVDVASVQGIANVGQLLQSNTLAAGSAQVTSAIATEFVVNGGLGASTISLRGLGANRTLVLVNGRRAGPAGIKGAVSAFDLNVLPLTTIERVEILKDGASSIYGSDAIAGVVNIITRKDDGVSLDAFVSAPTDGGGEESRLSLSYGKSGARGSFRVTADYNKQEQLKRGERDYFRCGNEFIFDQETGARGDSVDPRTGEFSCNDLQWGHVWIYDYAADTNVPGGSLLSQPDLGDNLGQFIPGYAAPNSPSQLTAPSNFFPVRYDRLTDGITNSDHPFQDKQSLRPEVELLTLYGEGELTLTDTMTAYTEVLLNRRKTYEDDYRQYWSYIYSGDHSFAPDPGDPNCADADAPEFDDCGFTMQQVGGNPLAAAAGWNGAQWFSPTAITDHNDQSNEVDYVRAVLGLRGEFTDNWSWDLSYMYSKSDADYTEQVIFDDSIRDQNWLFGSCAGDNTSVRDVPCLDVPWFDPELLRGNVSPELQAFLFGTDTGNTEYTQWSVDGFVTGDLFELPAGSLAAAIGFHYREDEINDTPGPETLRENTWFGDFARPTIGDDETSAVFVEFDIPVLVDRPGFENLTLNASARYTDVKRSGSDTTWKAGVNWQVIPSLRLRANKATSFRTPALFELFLEGQTSTISQNSDPCINYQGNFDAGQISENVFLNCQADPAGLAGNFPGGTITPTVITGGGLGVLKAETAESISAGFIWQPGFADLSVSVDYFDFEVKDEVDQFGATNIIDACYESDFGFAFGGTEPLCNLFDRSGLNDGLDNVRDSFINIAQQRNRGWDFASRYGRDVGRGTLQVDLKATLTVSDVQALFDETPEDFNGRVGEPEWVGEANFTYSLDKWSFFYGLDWIGRSNSEREFSQGDIVRVRGVDYRVVRYTDDVYYSNLSASYAFDNGVTVLVGGANVFDQEPPQLTRTGAGNEYTPVGNGLLTSNYDMLGRRFFVNAKWDFE
jgi:iron complex outermembrane receptor protein